MFWSFFPTDTILISVKLVVFSMFLVDDTYITPVPSVTNNEQPIDILAHFTLSILFLMDDTIVHLTICRFFYDCN